MAEESDKEQLQQSGNNHTAHALYASGSIYAVTKVGVATKIQILVRPKPDQLDRLLRPCQVAAPGSEKPPVPQESGSLHPLTHEHQLYTLWLWCHGRACRFSLPLEEVLPPLFLDFGMTNSTTSDCSAYLPN